MTFADLTLLHPATAAELLEAHGGDAQAAAHAWSEIERAAVGAERARAVEHTELGMAAGRLDLAIAAVRSGAPVDPDVYLHSAARLPYRHDMTMARAARSTKGLHS